MHSSDLITTLWAGEAYLTRPLTSIAATARYVLCLLIIRLISANVELYALAGDWDLLNKEKMYGSIFDPGFNFLVPVWCVSLLFSLVRFQDFSKLKNSARCMRLEA